MPGHSLKELDDQSPDVVERTCIGVVLRLTGGNRAAAAEAPALNGQGLKVKLKGTG